MSHTPPVPAPRPTKARVYGGLVLGVVAVSWAAPLIRFAEAPSLAISAWRLTFAATPLLLLALLRGRAELASLSARIWGWLVLSGLALALHFATWIASLQYTTVASSVALVTTQPVWVALFAWVALSERVGPRGLAAIGLCLAGSVLIGARDFAAGGQALWGDVLAVMGAILAAVYFVIGRRVRDAMSLGTYVGVVYSVAAVALMVAHLFVDSPLTGFTPRTWAVLVGLAVVPQLIGHSLLNASVRHLSAPFVAVTTLGEPVLSTLWAVPLLGETPDWVQLVGGGMALVGVLFMAREEALRQPPPPDMVPAAD
ncbi:DMT family transporter [Pyxidicoccus xibeiensis]|uniref:DMT family transporter n=1 Tax=Pyxidicoccus xibeiensis TaxID=2906759 RepID=UPI0020A74B63|nr:DMT family transporter [Pyxidicoccus xibeiensis]MCP3141310.1 DMT family transporter [Pyxidicoccus xibeiensis]